MAYFPFFAEIEGKECLIVGGGRVAHRKARDILPYGALIRVVSPSMSEGLRELADSGDWGKCLVLQQREYEDKDLLDADFVIAATSSQELNSHISLSCKRSRIPVNVVDVKEECSFIFPSIVRAGPVVVGISTGGASPVIARYLKARIGEILPENLGPFTEQLGTYRDRIKALFPHSPSIRSALFYELAEEGLNHMCCLTHEQAETIINRKLEQGHE